MGRPLRIPGLVDILWVETPEEIGLLAADQRLDRRFGPGGPLLNRVIVGRVRRVLRLGTVPLPTVAPRDAPGRAARQAALEAELRPLLPQPADARHLDALAAHVLGRRDRLALGPLVQEVVGRLFQPDYRGTPESWEAACLLDAAVRSFNPFRQLAWRLTGRIGRARKLLAERVASDPAALHATGIAVHNLVHAFERMRGIASRPWAARGLTADTVVSRCLAAPESVLRQATAHGTTAAGAFRPGTVVVLGLETGRAASLRRDVAFLAGHWSRCPATDWVPALLAAVWERVAADLRTVGASP